MRKSPATLDPAGLSRLIGLAYDAPFLPSGWRDFTGSAARLLQTRLAMIHHMDHDDPGSSFHIAGGIDESFSQAFSPRWSTGGDDIYLQAMLEQPAGLVRLSSDIVDPAVAQQTEIHNQLAKPWRLEYFLFASLGTRNGVTSVLSLGRSMDDPPFDAADIGLLAEVLLPHLCRSINTHASFAGIRQNNALLAAMLDMVPCGVVAFDAGGKAVLVNETAAAIFARDNSLALRNGRIHATDPHAQALLDAALKAAIARGKGQPAPVPTPVPVARKSTSQPCQFVFSPFSRHGESIDFPRRTACMALIHEPGPAPQPDLSAALVRIYGLSKAEARLCRALLDGQSAQEAAVTLNVSHNTIKTHLAGIFQKTGVHSQTALLQLLTKRSRTLT